MSITSSCLGAGRLSLWRIARLFAERYPDINGPDYTSIIDEKSFVGLQGAPGGCARKRRHFGQSGERTAAGQRAAQVRAAPLLNVTDDMELMQCEMFGPILPVLTCGDKQEVADYINSHDRPLAIYLFTNDRDLRDFYISRM
jgi:coniferyl-aldehyde dehydrogenase